MDIFFLELVHRLDKDTSGILLLAKKKSVLRNLHQQLREKKIKKYYIALVHGLFKTQKIITNFPILKKKNKFNLMSIHKNGKPSKTIFTIKKIFLNSTLVRIHPITGRTHQIRIHASKIGHPILYDSKYGNNNLNLKINKILQKKRLFLHAYQIFFLHPKNNKKMCIKAPLDQRFENAIKILSKNN